jgi:hypothetical protein
VLGHACPYVRPLLVGPSVEEHRSSYCEKTVYRHHQQYLVGVVVERRVRSLIELEQDQLHQRFR